MNANRSPAPDDSFDCINPTSGDLYESVTVVEIATLIADKKLSLDGHARIHGTEEWAPMDEWFALPEPPPPLPPPRPPPNIIKPNGSAIKSVSMTCPRCGVNQNFVAQRSISPFGWAFFGVGLLLTPFLIGIPLMIIGLLITKTTYHCRTCDKVF